MEPRQYFVRRDGISWFEFNICEIGTKIGFSQALSGTCLENANIYKNFI